MFIKNDYVFFTQIEVSCFVHIYQILRPTDTRHLSPHHILLPVLDVDALSGYGRELAAL